MIRADVTLDHRGCVSKVMLGDMDVTHAVKRATIDFNPNRIGEVQLEVLIHHINQEEAPEGGVSEQLPPGDLDVAPNGIG